MRHVRDMDWQPIGIVATKWRCTELLSVRQHENIGLMMQPNTAESQQSGERPKLRGRPWPKGVSGNPSGKAKGTGRRARIQAKLDGFVEDLGGEVSAIELVLLQQAALLAVRVEDQRRLIEQGKDVSDEDVTRL